MGWVRDVGCGKLVGADASCCCFKYAFRARWRGPLRRQRTRRRACPWEFVRTIVARDNFDDIPIQESSPLTTRHRYTIPHEGGNARCVRRLPMAHYKPRSRLWRPCFPRAPPKQRTGTRPGRTPADAVCLLEGGGLQRSTDAWAQSPAPARVGSHTLRFGRAARANGLYSHWCPGWRRIDPMTVEVSMWRRAVKGRKELTLWVERYLGLRHCSWPSAVADSCVNEGFTHGLRDPCWLYKVYHGMMG